MPREGVSLLCLLFANKISSSPTSPKPNELLFDGRKCIRFVFCVLDVYSIFIWCTVNFSSLLKFFAVSLLAFYRENFSMRVIVFFRLPSCFSSICISYIWSVVKMLQWLFLEHTLQPWARWDNLFTLIWCWEEW